MSDAIPKIPLLLRTALGTRCERTPIWCMRQAGRSLPEYHETKGTMSFMTAIRDVQLATELTLQPVRRYQVDGAVIYSDILTLPQALGFNIEIIPGEGVVVHNPLTEDNIHHRLQTLDFKVGKKLTYVYEVVASVRQVVDIHYPNVAVIGFAGAPWTLLTYMLGDQTKNKLLSRRFIIRYPEITQFLFECLEKSITDHLAAQIHAGAHVVQLFDSWAGCVGIEVLRTLLIPSYTNIINALAIFYPKVPLILFAKDVHPLELSSVNPKVLAISESTDPVQARQYACVQGNLDPTVLYGTKNTVVTATRKMQKRFGNCQPWIANLGHGVPRDIDPNMITVMVSTIRE